MSTNTASSPPQRAAAVTVAVLGFPTDSNSSHLRGPAKAPARIRLAMNDDGSNSFAESELDLATPGVFEDLGDVALREDESDLETIEAAIEAQLALGRRVLSLGGDHSITYPVVRAYALRYPGLCVVHVDAHPDLYPEFGGNRYSHACPFARILEDAGVESLTQIGIRTMSSPQREMADRHGVRVFGPSQLQEACSRLPGGPVYLSVDLDGLDPAFAPGVSHREPGGLSVRDVLDVLAKIPGNVVGCDVVELNPERDVQDMTATVAAKLSKEFIARMHADARRNEEVSF
jgi:agmatinase